MICEEANRAMMKFSSIPVQVSADCAIPYIPCDPENEDADKLGILPANWTQTFSEDAKQEFLKTSKKPIKTLKKLDDKLRISNEIRENIWLDKVKRFKSKNIIFILGVAHTSIDKGEIDYKCGVTAYDKKRVKLSNGFDILLEKNGFKVTVLPDNFVSPRCKRF